jgi:hypothetical protein
MIVKEQHWDAKKRAGLGDKLTQAIHAGLDSIPEMVISPEMKAAIKSCGGCGKRRQAINHAEQVANDAIAKVKDFLHKKLNT